MYRLISSEKDKADHSHGMIFLPSQNKKYLLQFFIPLFVLFENN